MSAAARKNKAIHAAPGSRKPSAAKPGRRTVIIGAAAAGLAATGLAAVSLARGPDGDGAGSQDAGPGGAAAATPPLTAAMLRAGEHYEVVEPPVVVAQAAGRIDVVEFFWYGCPHCFALEAELHKWVRQLPTQAAFRRVPVGFAAAHRAHQRLFYALQVAGELPRLHYKVFEAIHLQRRLLTSPSEVLEFMVANGVSGERWQAAMQDARVERLAREAKELGDSFKLDGVPAMAVAGRYYTSGAKAGDNLRALQVARLLVDKVLR